MHAGVCAYACRCVSMCMGVCACRCVSVNVYVIISEQIKILTQLLIYGTDDLMI